MCCTPFRTSDARSLLESQRDELLKSFRNREAISAAREPDGMDQIVALNEQDTAMRRFTREAATIREITAALKRLDRGEYGICLDCELKIQPKRLAVIPWAPRCGSCQEAAEAEDQAGVAFA